MKNSWKRVTAGVLALAMVAGTIPANVEWGDFFGKGAIVAQAQTAVTYMTWNDTTKQFEEATAETFTTVEGPTEAVWGAAGTTTTYVVSGENVEILGRITVKGTVNLILCDGAKLTASQGIIVAKESDSVINTLNIFGQAAGTGKLIATGFGYAAGIGGVDRGAGGTVTINGGQVTATGFNYAAGIGGGNEGAGGTVTINGGNVTANGGNSAAGIGGGNGGAGGTVTINGGNVTANGGNSAAGIGGGDTGAGGTVTINGGNVTAEGGEQAAGIGCGIYGTGGAVTINGGQVTATGGVDAVGIGKGDSDPDNGALTIADGLVLQSKSGVTWSNVSNTGTSQEPDYERSREMRTAKKLVAGQYIGVGDVAYIPANTYTTFAYSMTFEQAGNFTLKGVDYSENHYNLSISLDVPNMIFYGDIPLSLPNSDKRNPDPTGVYVYSGTGTELDPFIFSLDAPAASNWTAEIAPDNQISYTADLAQSGDTVTVTPSEMHFRSADANAHRPAGYCWVGVKITAPEGAGTITQPGDPDYTEVTTQTDANGRKYFYEWFGLSTKSVCNALASSDGIISYTVPYKIDDVDTPLTVNIDVNNLTLKGVDTSTDTMLTTENGKLVYAKVSTLAELKAAVAAPLRDTIDTQTVIELANDIQMTTDDLLLEINVPEGKHLWITGGNKYAIKGVNDYNGGEKHGILISGGGKIVFDNIKLTEFAGAKHQYNTYPIWTKTAFYGVLGLYNVTIDKFSRTAVNANGGSVILEGCTITGGTTAVDSNGKYFQSGVEVYKANVELYSTTITGIGSTMEWPAACVQLGNANYPGNGTITVESGTYTATGANAYALIVAGNVTNASEGGWITVNGGKFNGGYLLERSETGEAPNITYGDRAYKLYLNGGVYSTLDYDSNVQGESASLIGSTILLGEGKSLYNLSDDTYKFGVADTATLSIGAKVGTTETDTTTYDGTSKVALTATPSVTKVDAQNTTSAADDYTIAYNYQWSKLTDSTTTPATYTDISGATSATYNVGPEVAKSGTYKCTAASGAVAISDTETATINAAAASVTTAPTAKTGLTYTGSAQDLVTAGTASGGTLKYAWEKEDKYDKTKVKHITKDSLTTDDLASWKEGDIYQIDINSMDFPLSLYCSPVKVGENTFTPPSWSEVQIDKSGSNLIFSLNGDSQISYPGNAFIVKKITKNGNTYSLELEVIDINEKDWKWTTETPKGIAVGTYPVYYKVTPTDPANYTAVEPTLVGNVTIGQGTPSITITPATNLKYTGSAQTLATVGTTNKVGDNTYYFAVTDATVTTAPEAASDLWKTTIDTKTDIGTYKIWYKAAETINYAAVEPTALATTVSIGVADNGWTTAPVLADNQIYTGSEISLVKTPGTPKFGEATAVTYAVTTTNTAPAETGAWTTYDALKAAAPGTYYVWYQIGGGDNWNAVAPTLVGTVTITEKSDQTWTIEMPDYIYDGTAHAPTINGIPCGEITYTYLTSQGIVLAEAPTEPGDYMVWVAASGDNSHASKLESADYSIKSAKFAAGNTVSFKEKVEFNFLVEATDANTVEGAYVLFTYDHYGEKMTVKKAIDKSDKNGKYYRVRLPLTASEMAIDIKAELYLPTLDKPVDTKTRSIKNYAEAAIKSNLDGAEVLKAMLNYGGYTQTALGNNTALLANSGEGIAVDVSAVAPKSATTFVRPTATAAKVTYKGSTAMTTSDLYVRHYFTVDLSLTTTELNAVMVKIGDNAPVAISKLKKNSTGYYCETTPELAYELDKENGSIVVYGFAGAETADSPNAISIENYNVIDYCEAVANSNKQTTDAKNMVKAMYSYYTAAKAYVESRS